MKIKLWVSLVLAFFAFIFITQNTETTNVSFLVWSVEMSLVLLVFIMLGSGVIIGWLLNSYVRHSLKKSKEQQAGDQLLREDAVTSQENFNTDIQDKKDSNE